MDVLFNDIRRSARTAGLSTAVVNTTTSIDPAIKWSESAPATNIFSPNVTRIWRRLLMEDTLCFDRAGGHEVAG